MNGSAERSTSDPDPVTCISAVVRIGSPSVSRSTVTVEIDDAASTSRSTGSSSTPVGRSATRRRFPVSL